MSNTVECLFYWKSLILDIMINYFFLMLPITFYVRFFWLFICNIWILLYRRNTRCILWYLPLFCIGSIVFGSIVSWSDQFENGGCGFVILILVITHLEPAEEPAVNLLQGCEAHWGRGIRLYREKYVKTVFTRSFHCLFLSTYN